MSSRQTGVIAPRFLSAAIIAAAGVVLGASTAVASHNDTHEKSSLQQRVIGQGNAGFELLQTGTGEGHTLREDLVNAGGGRAAVRESLLYFGQLTDVHVIDEESPSRVEFLDPIANTPVGTVSSAWRPFEAFTTQVGDLAIQQMNEFVPASPVLQGDNTRAAMEFAISTGDNIDNQQKNETEWFVRLLEGGALDPNSGVEGPIGSDEHCPGVPAGEAAKYTGVQDYDDTFENPHFYDPDVPFGQYANWPLYPGLMDRAQQPFTATGLDVPFFVAFGNHDGLAQGNAWVNQGYEQIGTGCLKPMIPATEPGEAMAILNPGYVASVLSTAPENVALVPKDPNRQYVSKKQYKALYDTLNTPNKHGFGFVDPAEEAASNGAAGYYSWNPKPGFRFISLDTVSEGGVIGPSAEGNIDDPQWQWLKGELDAATAANELVILFGHHPLRSLTSDVPDEASPPCTGVNDSHNHDVNAGCDLDPRISHPVHKGGALKDLILADYPHVLAFVAGHTHENLITPQEDADSGFWMIETAAEIDFPQQNRLIEIMDNKDGTLSIFGTVLDHASATAVPASGTSASAFSVEQMASISRALSFNDPQTGESGGRPPKGSGVVVDRNVELLINDPR